MSEFPMFFFLFFIEIIRKIVINKKTMRSEFCWFTQQWTLNTSVTLIDLHFRFKATFWLMLCKQFGKAQDCFSTSEERGSIGTMSCVLLHHFRVQCFNWISYQRLSWRRNLPTHFFLLNLHSPKFIAVNVEDGVFLQLYSSHRKKK